MAFSSFVVLGPLISRPACIVSCGSGCANQPTDFVTKSERWIPAAEGNRAFHVKCQLQRARRGWSVVICKRVGILVALLRLVRLICRPLLSADASFPAGYAEELDH